MKFKRIQIILLMFITLLITGCVNETDHVHTFSDEWSYNEEYHYHEATCKHKDEVSDKELHKWNDGIIIKAPTLEEEGTKEYTCTVCEATKQETLNKLTHEHKIVHHEGKPATCTEDGYKPYDTCEDCDYTTYEKIPALNHIPSEWITDKDATCLESGTRHKECTRCHETLETETINALNHIPSEWIIDKNATCLESGTRHKECTRCHETIETETLDALNHDIVHHEGKAATCTESGYKPYDTCNRCDYTTYEEIGKLDHTYSEEYKSDDNEHWKECTCGKKAEIGAHTWDEGVVTIPATTTSTGLKVFTCSVCHTTKEEVLPQISDKKLTICGYNTQGALEGYPIYEGIRLYKKGVELGSSLYWHKVALTIQGTNYVVTRVMSSGESLVKDYDYLILAYKNDDFVNANFEVGDVIEFSTDITSLTDGQVNITFSKLDVEKMFTIDYELGYEHYETKDELYEAFFTDYYYFLLNNTDCDMLSLNINNVSDFLVYCKNWDANGRSELAGVGNAFGKYYLSIEENGTFETQPTTHFIGYCYQNNKYVEFLEFLEVFFAYWRTDEGYTKNDIHGNDFFYSSWAAFVDTCKFFYFTSSTLTTKYAWFTVERSPRVHYALDHVPGVGSLNLQKCASSPVTLPTIERMNYDFLGWYDSEEGGNRVTTVSADATVYARFRRVTHTVKFINGGIIVSKETVKRGLRISEVPTVSLEGYDFAGWTLADFTTYDYLNAVQEDLVFYANFIEKRTNVGSININAYNTQNATTGFDMYMGLELFKAGVGLGSSKFWYRIGINYINGSYVVTSIALSGENNPTSYDYLLLAYSGDTSNKYQTLVGFNVQVGDLVEFSSDLNSLNTGSINIDVTFTRSTSRIHSLILVSDTENFTYKPYYVEGKVTTLPTPTKAGYTFIGWYDNPTFAGDKVTEISENTTTNIILYARWVEITVDDVLSMVSDVVTSDTLDYLPKKFEGATLTWSSENPNLYTIDGDKGYTNRLYQTHQKQTVKVFVKINNGEKEVTKEKVITINPVIFDDMSNPKAVYFAVSSASSYTSNSARYKAEGTMFSQKFRENMNMIYYAFGIPQANGTVTIDTTYLDVVKQLKNDGIRVLLVIDGANKAPLQAMVQLCNTDSTRKTFVDNIINLVKTYNFDGVDIDWEFPGTSGLDGFTTEIDQKNLNKLLRDLRQGLDAIQDEGGSPYIISTAIPATSWGSSRYDFVGNAEVGGINTYCDYVNVMSYDLNNTNYTSHVSSCYASAASNNYRFGAVYGAEQFIKLGLSREKVILGSAAYGKTYKVTGTVDMSASNPALGIAGTLTKLDGVSGSYASGTIYYSAISILMNDSNYVKYTEYNNGKVVGSYLYNQTDKIFITYDSSEGVKEKCNYAKANGMGIMVWAYGEDATDTVVNTICDNL